MQAIGNVYSLIFSQNAQVRLFPEGVYICMLFICYLYVLYFHLVVIALIFAVIGSAMVHRVCATTWLVIHTHTLYIHTYMYIHTDIHVHLHTTHMYVKLITEIYSLCSFIFSMVALYYLNKISQSTYSSSQPGTQTSRLTRTTIGKQNGKSPSPKSPRKDRRSHH